MLQGVESRPDMLQATTELPTVAASPLTDVGAAGFVGNVEEQASVCQEIQPREDVCTPSPG